MLSLHAQLGSLPTQSQAYPLSISLSDPRQAPASSGMATLLSVSPSAKFATWRYWFRLSHDVYGGNRSFASYTKTKMVESAV
jgi:hypothetical protein